MAVGRKVSERTGLRAFRPVVYYPPLTTDATQPRQPHARSRNCKGIAYWALEAGTYLLDFPKPLPCVGLLVVCTRRRPQQRSIPED